MDKDDIRTMGWRDTELTVVMETKAGCSAGWEDGCRSTAWEPEAEIFPGCLRGSSLKRYHHATLWESGGMGTVWEHENCADLGVVSLRGAIVSRKELLGVGYMSQETILRIEKWGNMKLEKLLHIKGNKCQSKDTAYRMGKKSLPATHIRQRLNIEVKKLNTPKSKSWNQ